MKNNNHYLLLSLEGNGTTTNRDAIGALVTISAGGKQQVGVRRSTTGYLSQNDHRMHFGIADATKVDFVEIKWPLGKVQRLENLDPNQILTIKEE